MQIWPEFVASVIAAILSPLIIFLVRRVCNWIVKADDFTCAYERKCTKKLTKISIYGKEMQSTASEIIWKNEDLDQTELAYLDMEIKSFEDIKQFQIAYERYMVFLKSSHKYDEIRFLSKRLLNEYKIILKNVRIVNKNFNSKNLNFFKYIRYENDRFNNWEIIQNNRFWSLGWIEISKKENKYEKEKLLEFNEKISFEESIFIFSNIGYFYFFKNSAKSMNSAIKLNSDRFKEEMARLWKKEHSNYETLPPKGENQVLS